MKTDGACDTLHSTLYTFHSTLTLCGGYPHPHESVELRVENVELKTDGACDTLHSTLYTFHSTLTLYGSYPHPLPLYTLHSTLYTLHSQLYTQSWRAGGGGGRTISDGYRAFIGAVKADNPGVDVSTEEEGESYIDVVDSLIVLYAGYERLGRGVAPEFEMLPVFNMLYHGCVAMYGSYSVIDGITPWDEKWGKRPEIDEDRWRGRFPDQFALEFARGVAWGLQPTVHKLLPEHQTDPKWAAEWKFIKDTAAFYHANREFLFDGEMCEPGEMKCESQAVDFFVRGCYTKEEKFRSVRQPAVPTVLHSVWKAPDGRTAAVLVNWTRKPQRYSLSTPDVSASGVMPPLSWGRAVACPL